MFFKVLIDFRFFVYPINKGKHNDHNIKKGICHHNFKILIKFFLTSNLFPKF